MTHEKVWKEKKSISRDYRKYTVGMNDYCLLQTVPSVFYWIDQLEQ